MAHYYHNIQALASLCYGTSLTFRQICYLHLWRCSRFFGSCTTLARTVRSVRILYSALKPTQIQNNSCGWELSSMPADKVSVCVCLLYVPTTAFCVDRAVELLVIKFFFIIDCTRLQIWFSWRLLCGNTSSRHNWIHRTNFLNTAHCALLLIR